MVRTQIQLPREQLEQLREMAAAERCSVSALVRRGVEHVLAGSITPSRDELLRRASEVIGAFDSGLSDVSERHDDYLEEAYMS